MICVYLFPSIATSTDAERAFSSGRLTVSRLRHSLSDSSVRAGTLLASWSRIPDIVDEDDAAKLLESKNKAKASAREVISVDDTDDDDAAAAATPCKHAEPVAGSSRSGSSQARPGKYIATFAMCARLIVLSSSRQEDLLSHGSVIVNLVHADWQDCSGKLEGQEPR